MLVRFARAATSYGWNLPSPPIFKLSSISVSRLDNHEDNVVGDKIGDESDNNNIFVHDNHTRVVIGSCRKKSSNSSVGRKTTIIMVVVAVVTKNYYCCCYYYYN